MKLLTFEVIEESNEHIEVLYELLGHREHSISHELMPSFDEHKKFVISSPYRVWMLIKSDQKYIGTLYLTHENHISISLTRSYSFKFIEVLLWVTSNYRPLPESKSITPANFQMNVPIDDVVMSKSLERLGHKKIQVTHVLRIPSQ
jgi:hypothetical protein